MEKMPITKEGLEKLKEELAHLEREEKPKNIRAIRKFVQFVIKVLLF